ncbi:hypothetical protein V6N13_048578 [Hibiscus sabdariffa]
MGLELIEKSPKVSTKKTHQSWGFHRETVRVEACAFAEGVRVALDNGWQRVILEGDATLIVAKLNASTLDRSVAASYLQEAWKTLRERPGFMVRYNVMFLLGLEPITKVKQVGKY